MTENPYERFQCGELILRDELAIDRTILANERTVLAYLRGALTLFIAGVTFLHFFDRGLLLYIGIICVPLGIATGIFGVLRYRKMNKCIRATRESIKSSMGASAPPPADQPANGGSARGWPVAGSG